jgi:hypothetical protein
MNNFVKHNIPWLSSGALSTLYTRLYWQLKYTELPVLVDRIKNYVLPTDSTVTGQPCQFCFLHSTDISC